MLIPKLSIVIVSYNALKRQNKHLLMPLPEPVCQSALLLPVFLEKEQTLHVLQHVQMVLMLILPQEHAKLTALAGNSNLPTLIYA